MEKEKHKKKLISGIKKYWKFFLSYEVSGVILSVYQKF